MQEHAPERTTTPPASRSSPIRDETLEEYVMQINKGERSPQPLSSFETESLEEIKAWAICGMSFLVAGAIAKYGIPDNEAKNILANALDNNSNTGGAR